MPEACISWIAMHSALKFKYNSHYKKAVRDLPGFHNKEVCKVAYAVAYLKNQASMINLQTCQGCRLLNMYLTALLRDF